MATIALTFVALGFLLGAAGPLPPALGTLAGCGAAAGLVLQQRAPAESVPRAAWIRWLPWAAVAILPVAPVGGLVAVLVALGVRARGSEAPVLFALGFGALAAGLFDFAQHRMPAVWFAADGVAEGASRLGEALTGHRLALGATAAGLTAWVAAAGTLVAAWWIGARRRWDALGLALLALPVLATTVTVLPGILHVVTPRDSSLQALWTTPQLWYFHPLLAALLALPVFWFTRGLPELASRASLVAARSAVAVLALPVLAGVAWASATSADGGASARAPRVFLHNEPHLDTRVPVHGSYMEGSGGMFGLLPKALSMLGYEVETGPWAPEVLERTDVLILVNLQESFSDADEERIREFVHAGGGLLLLADHTGTSSIRDPVNGILEGLGIELNFDSGVAFEKSWKHQMQLLRHPVTAGLGGNEDVQVWIGGTLTVERPAFPLIVGRYAFADLGNRSDRDRNYLGDMAYGAGEQLGDLVLVAGREYGAGRILAFGDTSSFQTGSGVLNTPFRAQAMAWLAGESASSSAWWRPTAVVLLFALAVLPIVLLVPRPPVLLGAAAVLTCLPLVADPEPGFAWSDLSGRVAFIDSSHGQAFDRAGWNERSIDGLTLNLHRAGLTPIVTETFPAGELAAAEVLVLLAPTRRLTPDELRETLAFVEAGGTLLVTTGWPDADAVELLLEELGARIENLPLGSADAIGERAVAKVRDAWSLVSRGDGFEIVARVGDYGVVGIGRRGLGRAVVVADSDFLLNFNLEFRETYEPVNVEFLRELLEAP